MPEKQAMPWQAQVSALNGVVAKTIPVTPDTIEEYCQTGIAAYLEHYTHLWPAGDPSPYFNQYYRKEQVARELQNPAFVHGLVQAEGQTAGIFKLDLNRVSGDFHPGKALFVEKIYLKNAYTGMGLGSALLHQFCNWARELGMKGLWLETMYRGPARSFYLKHGFRFLGTTEVPYRQVLEAEKAMWAVGIDLEP